MIADFDADAQHNKPLAKEYGVSSFPTIKFFPKGEDKTPVDYNKARGEADFTAFLNEHCGTFRAPGGGLNDQVSRNVYCDNCYLSYFYRLGASLPLIVLHRNSSAPSQRLVVNCTKRQRLLDRASARAPNTTSG